MKNIFKELIINFHKSSIPIPLKREFSLPQFSQHVRKALIFIGMRRSGKTWSLYQIMQDLIGAGTDVSKMAYINFEDERLSEMQTKNLQEILDAYFELYPEYLHKNDIHFFFDEIHEIPHWEKFIRRLLDQEKMHVYLTGSSAKLLSKEIASSLRGRTYVIEIFPFSFREYLHAFNQKISDHVGTSEKIRIRHHLQNFLQTGGFPETIGRTVDELRPLLQGYTDSVIYRDIIDRYGITNVLAVRQLLSQCLHNSATIFSIQKIYSMFKSLGYEVSKNSLYEYMMYFEDAYCVFSLQKFDLSLRKSASSMKKIFAVDQGLITAFSMASEFDASAQLETALFAYLRRQTPHIFYYKSSHNKEVDFFITLSDQTKYLLQACVSLKNDDTCKREILGLERAMNEQKINTGIIVTLDDEEQELSVSSGTIFVKPAWKIFLLRSIAEYSK